MPLPAGVPVRPVSAPARLRPRPRGPRQLAGRWLQLAGPLVVRRRSAGARRSPGRRPADVPLPRAVPGPAPGWLTPPRLQVAYADTRPRAVGSLAAAAADTVPADRTRSTPAPPAWRTPPAWCPGLPAGSRVR